MIVVMQKSSNDENTVLQNAASHNSWVTIKGIMEMPLFRLCGLHGSL